MDNPSWMRKQLDGNGLLSWPFLSWLGLWIVAVAFLLGAAGQGSHIMMFLMALVPAGILSIITKKNVVWFHPPFYAAVLYWLYG